MFDSDDKLQVFERFRIDYRLPKHTKPKGDSGSKDGEFGDERMMSSDDSAWGLPITINNGSNNLTIRGVVERKPGFLAGLGRLFSRKEREPKPTLSVQQFFASVKNTAEELKEVAHRADGYEKALKNAYAGGQVALIEELKAGLLATRSEAQLIAMGSTKYITEETLVRFVKKTPKGLRLDWVCNFTRMIPGDILELKVRMDSLFIFDNYVVLHFDPLKKSWAETKAEKEARKDPILFGVISGSRKLYFVGNWVDELCDLTLDQIATTLGVEAVKELT